MSSFSNAPVTKGLMLGLAVFSLVSSMFDIKHYLHLQLMPHIYRDRQYWRLLVHQFASGSSGDLLLLELLLFSVSIPVERQFGSHKYASFLFVATLVSTAIVFIGLLLFYRLGVNHILPGPYALVFAVLTQYYSIVPSIYHFKIAGLTFSTKFYTYILSLQLSLIRFPGTMLAAISGIIAGYLYRSDVIGLKTYRLPSVLRIFGTKAILPLIGSTRPPRISNIAVPDDITATTQAPTETSNTAPDPQNRSSVVQEWVNSLTGRTPGLRSPSQQEITEVSAMFPNVSRQTIVLALQRSPTRDVAVEALLLASQNLTTT